MPKDLETTAGQALALMDLTSLNDHDTEAGIAALCHRADTPAGHPAAVCIHRAFIPTARRSLAECGLDESVRVATVANFPDGADDVGLAEEQTRQAIGQGADEVDVVFPWAALIAGNEATGQALVAACREACGEHILKVIIETGELARPALIRRAARLAIAGGADFVKTSTGKAAVNATPEAARTILETIADSGRDVGCKVAGGIRTTDDAAVYLDLAESIMGAAWLTPDHFRIGASGLLDDVLATLGVESARHCPGARD